MKSKFEDLKTLAAIQTKELQEVMYYKDKYIVSDSYLAVVADNYNGVAFRNDMLAKKLYDRIKFKTPAGLKPIPITNFKKEELVDCISCKGTGYEKNCPCGSSFMEFTLDEMVNGPQTDHVCPLCENTGVASAAEDEEGNWVCESCGGTGKDVKYPNFSKEYETMRNSRVSKRIIQRLYHVLGDSVVFYPTENPLAAISFKYKDGCGTLMPMLIKDEEEK